MISNSENYVNVGKYRDLWVSNSQDTSGDLEVRMEEHSSEYTVSSWLNKDTAKQLITHLQNVFEL